MFLTSYQNLAMGFDRTVVFNNFSFKKGRGEERGIALGYGVVCPDFSVKEKRSKASSPELRLGLLV